MNHTDAEHCMGLLVGGTGGWNSATDETFVIYTRNFQRLADKRMAEKAVERIIDTWTDSRRPPWATVLSTYREINRRDIIDFPTLEPTRGRETIPFAEGRKIAASAYAGECARQGREPRWDFFDKFAGLAAHDPAEAAAPYMPVPAPVATEAAPERLKARVAVIEHPTDADWLGDDVEDAGPSAAEWAEYDTPGNPIAEAAREVTDRLLGDR
jgi:hypothetical protein